MTKTGELVERYVNDEFKAQVTDFNSNSYIGIYGVALGVVIANVQKILDSINDFALNRPFWLTITLKSVLMFSVIMAFFSVLMQTARVYNRNIRNFQLDREVMDLAAEERAKLMSEHVEDESVAKLDEKVSEAVRLRVTHKLIYMNKVYRRLNKQKAFAQFVTTMCLCAIALVAFNVFAQSMMP